MNPYTHRFFALLILGVFVLAGCGGADKPVRVSGVVRSKGKPVPDLVVHFLPEKGRESTGITDNSGAFVLKYGQDTEGAVRGKHKVFVDYRPHDAKQEAEIAMGKAGHSPEMKSLLTKYSKKASTLTYEVTQDGQEIPIELE
ncbi:transthyretin-like family protein [Frigoriglobus tundricola]|uniref:Carboxypeptidase regulatory-like domain-containing protein n=1 Tax=Frigoriglobus tundricola TaxID=2774151 RepID=A0A6M5YQC2_9BACT|nr:hypothetical protein [Frigoriglobus tundricola]QJW96239.1 hypothetical protein FTUN_3796 [Frigoriglobus tundricola]